MSRNRKGFTLIELMIVVAIIAVIAAIAIPNLLRSKMAANETTAIAALHTYCTGQNVYIRTQHTYAVPWHMLNSLSAGGEAMLLIDDAFARATAANSPRAGYWFRDIETSRNGEAYIYRFDYGMSAAPAGYNQSGINTFIVDTQGTVFQKDVAGAHIDRFPAAPDTENWIIPE